MIKMLVIDFDETLLHTDKTISEFSISVLRQAHDFGIKIVFATARPIRTMKYFLAQLWQDAVIYHNGAVTMIGENKMGQHNSIPIGEAVRILNVLKVKYPLKKLSVEINDKIYANFDVTLFWGKSKNDIEILKNSYIPTDFTDLPNFNADKILVELLSAKELEEINALLSPELYALLSDGGKLCQVMNKDARKINPVKDLARLWNISLADVTAFGDDYNDIEMLTQCGLGVAMGNAISEVKQIADVVTDTNNNDGVAKYIQKFILQSSKA